ncbi:MAG: spermidine/putrescine ABC transporter substrate-binding protein [Deltaproteobacteria bacterium]|nr:spermidine/putrescine ABC transporter substrate-binding protein [Deltaproteobacteria bacterium]
MHLIQNQFQQTDGSASSRRSLITFWLTVTFALALVSLSSCTKGKNEKNINKDLNVLVWTDYLSPEAIRAFEQEFGARVHYDTFSKNEDILEWLTAGEKTYDVIFPSDYMITELRRRKLLLPLNKEKLANIKNIDEKFAHLPADSEMEFCVPYSWGTTGIAVNTAKYSEEVKSWNIFWDEKLRGRLSLLDEARSGFVPALRRLGLSVNTVDQEELRRAQALLFEARDLMKAYTSDRYTELLRSREVWVAQAYSGDVVGFQRDYPSVQYILPEEGTELWVDNVCITKEAHNPELAHALINFLLRPNIAADFTNGTGFPTANREARQLIKPEILANPAVYPPQSTLEKSEFLSDAGEANDLYDSYWHDAKLPPSMRQPQ